MPRKRWYGRDRGLQVRMAFTMLMLIAAFLVFALVLFHFTHVGIILFLIPLVGLVFQYYASDKLVLLTAGARIVEPRQAPELHGIVQRLAQQADLPMPKVALVDSPMPNAFATGRSPKHAVVAATTGLLHTLPPAEVEAVLAHEMTHIRNRDMIVMTMAGSLAAVASWVVQLGFWFGLGGQDDDREGGLLQVLLVSLVAWLFGTLLMAALSRYREFAADRGGALLTGSPSTLASALLRVSGAMQRIPTQDLRSAQPISALFFSAPTKEQALGLFADHPPIQQRVERLQKLEREMSLR
jgi:heat shock protein HtpX